MQYNFILIRTDKGKIYANKILSSIRWINEKSFRRYRTHKFNTVNLTIGQFEAIPNPEFMEKYKPENTIIHCRAANPRTDWTIKLRELQDKGYMVVNSVDAIELTSNKLACALHLQGKVNHPKTWEYTKGTLEEFETWFEENFEEEFGLFDLPKYLIAKPLTSLEQGANVQKVKILAGKYDEIMKEFHKVPGKKMVIQEFIPYTALHRVIVIDGVALPYTFIDRVEWHKNGDWKVSCCLNRTTMKLNKNAPQALLELAEKTQKAVGGSVNFIDIFEYQERNDKGLPDVAFTNAEINTACSLNIHERLAKNAGCPDWNIHYRIAKSLVKHLLGE